MLTTGLARFVLPLLLLLVPAGDALAVTFSEFEFSAADWQSIIVHSTGNGGSATGTQQPGYERGPGGRGFLNIPGMLRGYVTRGVGLDWARLVRSPTVSPHTVECHSNGTSRPERGTSIPSRNPATVQPKKDLREYS